MTTHNVVSVSGGKDSTALLLVALAQEVPNLQAVFADTGNEHEQTYDYVRYLAEKTGVPIRWVKADLSGQFARRRKYVQEKWPEKGVPEQVIQRALSVLHPTGNPYLDLCMLKGRFPARRSQFCTQVLKRDVIFSEVFSPLMDLGPSMILSWQGVRREESLARRYLPECDEVGGGLFNYRPILKWPVEAVFEAHRYMGVDPNPLYSQGMSRVGCMPCVNCSKDELAAIAVRFPAEVERVREWEQLVSAASKRGSATFFAAVNDPTVKSTDLITSETHGIDRMVEWASTSRGGRQYDIFFAQAGEETGCSSSYGLCEGAAA